MSEWIKEEFKNLELGDKRLRDRFMKVMSQFELKPEGCINQIFRDEAAARKASYRFFSNDKVDCEKILDCHSEMTAERMKGRDVVLSLHDSSFFSYNTKPSIEGLGNIGGSLGKEETKGFIGHYALGVSEDGLPLGLQAVKCWSRGREKEWDKESERWVETLEAAEKTYASDTQMVFIADREADQFEILFDTHNRGHDFVIRSKYDRMVKGEDHYISWHMNKSKRLFDTVIYLPREKKEVEALVKFGEVTINDTNPMTKKLYGKFGARDIKLGIVEVKQKVVQKDEQPLRWVLLTNLELNNLEDAQRVIKYYRMRWQIESYFKVLKGGCCHVEHAGLRSFERLEKYTMSFSIIAWRMFWVQFVAHTDPELPAKSVLTDLEIEVLCVRNPQLEKNKLTTKEALKLIASLGGYNNRKGDGPPGMITLWRGFMIVRDRAEYHEELLVAGVIPKK